MCEAIKNKFNYDAHFFFLFEIKILGGKKWKKKKQKFIKPK